MATYDEYGPSRSDIQESFAAAAAKGAKYLAIVDQMLEDKYAVTCFTSTRAIERPCELVKMLREEDARSPYASHRISHVLDVKKDFDAQMAKWGKGFDDVLPAFAVKELADYKKEKDYARQKAEWQSQPFLTRLFSTPPLPPK